MMQVVFLLVFCILLITVALVTNYMLVARQEQRQGKIASSTPDEINWEAAADEQVQAFMANGQKFQAINRYRQLTGAGLKEAKDAVEYGAKYPDLVREKKKAPRPGLDDAPGVRDLLEEGRDDEAVDLYRRFAGVDEYTARAAVERIKRGE